MPLCSTTFTITGTKQTSHYRVGRQCRPAQPPSPSQALNKHYTNSYFFLFPPHYLHKSLSVSFRSQKYTFSITPPPPHSDSKIQIFGVNNLTSPTTDCTAFCFVFLIAFEIYMYMHNIRFLNYFSSDY